MGELLEKSGDLTWLDTDAGHLMLLPATLRSHWSGAEPPKDGRFIHAKFRWNHPDDPASDYDRACDVDDYVGILDVGSGQGVVLGQDPLPATCQALPNGGLLIARLYTSEIGTPSKLPLPLPDLDWTRVGTVQYDGSPLVLFDTTDGGDEEPVFPSMSITLTAGQYMVEHAQFKNSELNLWLVRLART
jgi:hypothetical protein